MAHAMISILALYNYDDEIFDQLELPEDADRQTIIDKILIDNAELSMVYTEPETVKMLIGNWSKIHSPNWERILEALAAEGILGGLPLGDGRILWCATEMNTKEEMDKLASICKEVTGA